MTTRARDLLSDALRHWAATRPDAPALLEGGIVTSWSALDRRASAIARLIAGAAVPPPGDGVGRVGLAVGPTGLGVAAIHGAARSGVTAVLVNPRLTGSEIASLLDAAGTRRLAVEASAGVDVPAGVEVVDLAAEEVWRDEAADVDRAGGAQVARGSFEIARGSFGVAPGMFVVPTSGSTATPKLACLPLDRLAASAAAWDAALPAATGWLLSLGLSHVAGLGIVGRAAHAGVPIVIPAGPSATDLQAAIEGARDAGLTVSHLSLVAAQLAALLEVTGDGAPPDGLRAVVLGGGPIPEALVRQAVRAGWPVVPSYGMTETASGVAALVGDDLAGGTGTVGRPLPGAEIRIDDGEILVRGPMVFAGYLDDEAATAAALDRDGWLHSGDHGTLDAAGRLLVLGRRDEAIIRGGENVAPREVEAVIAAHPAVADVAVIGVDDARWGQVPVAVVVPVAGAAPTDAALRDHARARLAGFKVPARFVLVRALPRTSIGKVARPELHRLVVTTPSTITVTTGDGQVLTVRELGERSGPAVVMLHATLSTSDQLLPLARRLANQARVVLIDRRGSGASAMRSPSPVPVARHVADVVAVLDRLDLQRAVLVGHSFGGVVALRTAIAAPDRLDGLLVWEPPYLVLAPPAVQRGMRAMTAQVQARFADAGPEAAARQFLEGVAGPGAWDRLHPRQRAAIGREGPGVVADIAMDGLTADGLESIGCATIVATGGASEPFYRPIADAVVERIGPRATRVDLAGLRHPAPITDPEAVAELVRRLLPGPGAEASPGTSTPNQEAAP